MLAGIGGFSSSDQNNLTPPPDQASAAPQPFSQPGSASQQPTPVSPADANKQAQQVVKAHEDSQGTSSAATAQPKSTPQPTSSQTQSSSIPSSAQPATASQQPVPTTPADADKSPQKTASHEDSHTQSTAKPQPPQSQTPPTSAPNPPSASQPSSSSQPNSAAQQPAPANPAAASPQPANNATTSGNKIDITFQPDKSKKVNACDQIVHVQFNRQYADGKIIKPGDYYSGFKYQDSVTTSDGWVIDHLKTEKTPDYQQGIGDGKKNGATQDAKMKDAPNTSGGDKGFYDPKTNPGGWKTINYEFSTFARCMKGPDSGTWYEGVQWTYTKTWQDFRDGKKGESKITNDNITTAPSASQIAALNKFNKDKGFVEGK